MASNRSVIVVALLLGACATNPGWSEDGGSARMDSQVDTRDTGSPMPDAGARDAGEPLPERCSRDNMFFEDEFGRMAYCIFVSTTGDDETGDGTAGNPFATIAHGIGVAVAQGVATGRTHAVAVSRGTYAERVELQNGISVYGKYDAEDDWSRADGNETTIEWGEVVGGQIEAVYADEITAPTVLEGFTVHAATAPAAMSGVDVIGIRVTDSVPILSTLEGLVLRDLEVRAGNGTAGADGTAGAMGDGGNMGETGTNGDTSEFGARKAPGAGAVTVCRTVTVEHTRGGAGGLGCDDGAWGCSTGIHTGADVGSPPPALTSCAGGTAGPACNCGDGNGRAGGPGSLCAATAATAGAAAVASTVRASVVDGIFSGRDGERGDDGSPGVGGSGGGGGGSGCDAFDWGPTGGGGSGGGSGGCGGDGGEGGQAGGSSIALIAASSTFSVSGCSFQSGTAMDGGDGALGGLGGSGGPGGPASTGGFAGGMGGDGQAGGQGGAGAGAPGGSSIAAMLCMSDVSGLELDALTIGVAGDGGAAATDGVAGINGITSQVFDGCEL